MKKPVFGRINNEKNDNGKAGLEFKMVIDYLYKKILARILSIN
jgi:hypothetical protein